MSSKERSDGAYPETLAQLEKDLVQQLGQVVGGGALTRALGFRTQGAFRQAFARKRLPIPVFELEGRRGRFAHTLDIARWMWTTRAGFQSAPQDKGEGRPNSP